MPKKKPKECTADTFPDKHPGEVLYEEFMRPSSLTAGRLALALRVPPQRINEILNFRRGITAETALRLAKFWSTTAEFWLDLQRNYELRQAQAKYAHIVEREVQSLLSPNITTGSQEKNSGVDDKRNSITLKLTQNQKRIYDLLSSIPISFDVLCDRSELSAAELSSILTMLELDNLAQRHPGDRYTKITNE